MNPPRFTPTTPANRRWRVIFAAFALLTFTLTHWPALEVPLPIHRPDLVAHLLFFGTWTLLATAAALFANALSIRNIILTFILAAVYAAIDELLQAIPFLRRNCALDDYGANLLGITSATLLLLVCSLWLKARRGSLVRHTRDAA